MQWNIKDYMMQFIYFIILTMGTNHNANVGMIKKRKVQRMQFKYLNKELNTFLSMNIS